jgi:hypothetical protein
MRAPTRHPRLAAAACKVYGLTIRLYPAEFRRAFGRELAVTFRNRVEDVLDGGGVHHWIAFAAHIALDTIRTYGDLATAGGAQGSVSLLGLTEGDAAQGGINRATVDVQSIFVAAGLALAVGGWYAFFVVLPTYKS